MQISAGTIPTFVEQTASGEHLSDSIPTTARAEGKDSIPLLTISAIMRMLTNCAIQHIFTGLEETELDLPTQGCIMDLCTRRVNEHAVLFFNGTYLFDSLDIARLFLVVQLGGHGEKTRANNGILGMSMTVLSEFGDL